MGMPLHALAAAALIFAPVSASPLLAADPPAAEQKDPSADRQSFEQRIEAELAEWQKRLDEWKDKLVEDGVLGHAWAMVQESWQDLRHETVAGWDGARDRFQTAYDDLMRAWQEQTAESGEKKPGDGKSDSP